MEKDTRGQSSRYQSSTHCDRKRCNGSMVVKDSKKVINGAGFCSVSNCDGRIENKGPGINRLGYCQSGNCFYGGGGGRGKWNHRECAGPCTNNNKDRPQRIKKHLGKKLKDGTIDCVEDLALVQRRVRDNMYSRKSHREAK